MSLLFDTNILLFILRTANYDEVLKFLNPSDVPVYISVVSEAEIKSLAIQNKWAPIVKFT